MYILMINNNNSADWLLQEFSSSMDNKSRLIFPLLFSLFNAGTLYWIAKCQFSLSRITGAGSHPIRSGKNYRP